MVILKTEFILFFIVFFGLGFMLTRVSALRRHSMLPLQRLPRISRLSLLHLGNGKAFLRTRCFSSITDNSLSSVEQQLILEIQMQADLVRSMKANQPSQETLTPAIQELQRLKAHFESVIGRPYDTNQKAKKENTKSSCFPHL
jgi:hypothetical protein